MTRPPHTATRVKAEVRRAPAAPPAGREFSLWGAFAVLACMTILMFIRIILQKAFLWEDFLYYSYPVRDYAATSLAAGYIPLWNPYTFSGMPFLADIQATVFYIPSLLLTLFVSGAHLNPYWLELMTFAHYPLAGMGMMLLASSYGMKRFPALFAGAAYMLSGFMIVHAIHQQIVTLVAWYPLIVWLFRRALQEKGWLWAFVTAPLVGHAVLAGHPQFALYLFFLLAIVFLFETLTTYRGAALVGRPALLSYARALIVVVFGLGTAMIQLLPTYELSGLSIRAHMTYENSTVGSLSWSQLWTLFFPKVLGSAGANGNAYYGETYWAYWETAIYAGLLPLLLAILAFRHVRSNRYVAFYAGLAVFALLYALGGHFILHYLFYTFVPGFSTFRDPGRMGIYLSFALSLLAGFALDELLSSRRVDERGREYLPLLAVPVGCGVLFWFLLQTGMLDGIFPFLKAPAVSRVILNDVLPSLLILLLSGALLFALIRRKGSATLLRLSLLPVFLLDMLLFGESQNASSLSPAEYFGQAAPIIAAIKNQSPGELFRVNTRNSSGMIMDRNQGMVDRIFVTEGYTPLALQRTTPPARTDSMRRDLLNIKYYTITNRQAGRLGLAFNPTYFPRAFCVYAARYARNEDDVKAFMGDSSFEARSTAIVEKELPLTLGENGTGHGSVAWTQYEPNALSFTVETDRNALVVVSEMYYPGWQAAVDGAPSEVYRADYSLRAVVVPAGRHTVGMRFAPSSYAGGRALTLASLLICAAGAGWSYRQRRKPAES